MRYTTAMLYFLCIIAALGTVTVCDCLSWRHTAYAVGYGLVIASAAYVGAFAAARRAR